VAVSLPSWNPVETRLSLLSRIRDHEDNESWQQFFDTYWKLIYNVARKAGLKPEEADDVVQEVVLTVSKKIEEFRYDPARGSFKGWLMKTTRWKILDQFGDRAPAGVQSREGRRTPLVEQVPDPAGRALERIWDEEWSKYLVDAGLERVRKRVKPLQYQIFDCYVIKRWSVADIMKTLDVSRNLSACARNGSGGSVCAWQDPV
jgi:RNA polymerase sigma-70 factor (ECF subfamily)